MTIIRIGVDTSKSVFVLHGVNAAEQPVLRKKLRRRQVYEFFAKLDPTRVGLEAVVQRNWHASCRDWGMRWFYCRRNTSNLT